MASPAVHLHKYHKVHAKQGGIDGCDHDQNVYHYRLVDGQMIFRAVRLGHGWESRPMSWQTLSCYKQRGDMQMAKRQAPPYEELKQVFIDAEYKIDRVRKVLKVNWLDAKQWLKDAGLIDSYNRPTDKVTTSKAQALLASVDAGIKPMSVVEATPVALTDNPQRKTCAACGEVYSWGTGGSWVTEGNVQKWFCENCAVLRIPKRQVICTECARPIEDCHTIVKKIFGDRLTENQDGTVNIVEPVRSMGCIEPELSDKATEVAVEDDNGCNYCERCGEPADEQVEKAWYCLGCRQYLKKQEYLRTAHIHPAPAPIGVEVPDYEDDGDLEASPYIIKSEPLIAYLGVAIDIIHAERKARTLALIEPIAANADALAMLRDMFDKGLL